MRTLRTIALVLLAFTSVSALFGGWVLLSDPSGDKMQMPLEMLKHSPFDDYLVPGIILFTANGLLSAVIFVVAIAKVRRYGLLVLLQGSILLTWIVTQVIMIRAFHWLHLVYGCTGLLLMLLGWLIAKDKGAVAMSETDEMFI